jgi:amidohydrolase
MHACGHDFHTSAALGAAILLKAQEATLTGTVRILFQAAEETGHGAPALIATGALDDAAVIFGIHNDPSLPVGTIGSKDGALTAGVDRFAITLSGTGSHAARPHEGNDPIIIVGQVISALQTLIARNVPSDHNAVVSITQVHSGSTWNVIPDSAWLEGTVRTFNQTTRELIERRFRQLLRGIADAFDAQIELDWQPGPPSVVNTARWVDFALAQGEASGFEHGASKPARLARTSPFTSRNSPAHSSWLAPAVLSPCIIPNSASTIARCSRPLTILPGLAFRRWRHSASRTQENRL